MKRASLPIAAGIFFLAVALKLSVPLWRNTSADESSASEILPETVTVSYNAGEYQSTAGTSRLSDWAVPTGLEDPTEQVIATFLESQAAYGDLAIPANVSYGFPQIDMECHSPLVGRVSSSFGYRTHPISQKTEFHYGADLAANSGDDIYSFAAGTVSDVGENDVLGKYLTITHPDGFSTLYGHCSTVWPQIGQCVAAGEKIAMVGDTGEVTGPNLHFELTQNGMYLNPEFYLEPM